VSERPGWLARLRTLFRREPAPGRWTEGAAWSWHGWIGFRPWTLPRRPLRLYRPRGHSRWKRAPLIVLLHGCKQTADDIARGTRIAALADAQGALVLCPEQVDGANPYRCWNWFDPRTASGKGEAAIVAAMIRKVRRAHRVDADRVLVAGMSAGAALAAVVGLHHRDHVSSVFTHAGIASGAALSAFTALTVMRRGPETDIAVIARQAVREASPRVVTLCVVQGLADDVVAPRHAAALGRQYLAASGSDVPAGSETTLPPADFDARDLSSLPYAVREREWRRDGKPVVRLVEIDNLGHAWGGGDDALPFNDARAPDVTAMLGKWLEDMPR
jgi:poly(hydroxyalkanoate) depolymerase family esterase